MALESAIVRIFKSNGIVVGAGFLVSQKHVITCAHVVTDALGISRDTQARPTEKIYLDFPLVTPQEKLTARVVFWRPVPPKGSTSVKGKEDIAALEIYEPIPLAAEPVDLLVETDLRGHRFRTFGFPVGHDDGLEATGVLRGQQATGWVQIEDVKETGVRLEAGFSGAPIWDEQLNGIVGMAIAADQKRPEAKIAFMIPIQVIAKIWTPLAELTIPPLSLTKKRRFIWSDRRFILPSIALLLLLSGVFMTVQKNTTSNEIATCTEKLQNQQITQKIVIAKFDNAEVVPQEGGRTEGRIFETLKKNFINPISKIEVCLVDKIVTNSQEADQLGKDENIKADIVIWGIKNKFSQFIYLEGITEEIDYLNELKFDLKDITSEVQNQHIPQLISVMVAHGLSTIYDFNQQIPEARKILEEALIKAKSKKIGKANEYNGLKIAEAYFILGTLFESPTDPKCKISIEDCRKALTYYQESIEYSQKVYQSYLNKGILHEKLDEPEEALKTYSDLIKEAPQSDSAVRGLYYRSFLYLNQNKNHEALKDLEIICKQEPTNIEYRYGLGLAQLKLGKIEEAKKTYADIKKYISNSALKAEVLSNLNTLITETNNKEVIKTVQEIISTLQ